MAVIPRYFSDSKVQPAVNTTRLDPSVAAAPYKAAEQSTGQVVNVLNQELGDWYKLYVHKQKEQMAQQKKMQAVNDSMYKAQSLANLSVQMNQMYGQAKQSATRDTNLAGTVDQQFQDMANKVILGAPSQAAQLDLTKRLIGLRAGLYNKATNDQVAISNQDSMNQIENIMHTLEGLAASQPEMAQDILENKSKDVFAAMERLGVPAKDRQKMYDKFSQRVQVQAALADIKNNPQAMKEQIAQGDFAHLGEGNVKMLQNQASSFEKAYTTQASQAMDDIQQRLQAGLPLPSNWQDILSTGARYGLTDKLADTQRLMELDKRIADQSLPAMRAALDSINLDAKRGVTDVSPKALRTLNTFMAGNIKALHDDPLTYAETKGTFSPVPVIQDFKNVNPQEAQDRNFRALQVEQLYGIPTSPLKKSDVANVTSQLADANVADKVAILKNVQSFGNRAVEQVATALHKTDPSLALAAQLSSSDPDTMSQIIKGKQLLKDGLALKTKEADVVDGVNSAFGTLFQDSPEIRHRYTEAAKSILAYQQTLGNSTDIKKTLSSVAGIIDVGGGRYTGSYKTIAPAKDMDSKTFQNMVSNLTDHQLWEAYGNGKPQSVGDNIPVNLAATSPGDYQYVADGSGTYNVLRNGMQMKLQDGSPYKIDLGKLAKDYPELQTQWNADKPLQQKFSTGGVKVGPSVADLFSGMSLPKVDLFKSDASLPSSVPTSAATPSQQTESTPLTVPSSSTPPVDMFGDNAGY